MAKENAAGAPSLGSPHGTKLKRVVEADALQGFRRQVEGDGREHESLGEEELSGGREEQEKEEEKMEEEQ